MVVGWCHVWGGPAAGGEGARIGGGRGQGGGAGFLVQLQRLRDTRSSFICIPHVGNITAKTDETGCIRSLTAPWRPLYHMQDVTLYGCWIPTHTSSKEHSVDYGGTKLCLYPLPLLQLPKKLHKNAGLPGLCRRRSSSSSWCRSWSSPGCRTGSWAGVTAARTGRAAGGGGEPAAECRCYWSGRSWRSAGWCRRRSAAASWWEKKSACQKGRAGGVVFPNRIPVTMWE